jgi:hypothetical protein
VIDGNLPGTFSQLDFGNAAKSDGPAGVVVFHGVEVVNVDHALRLECQSRTGSDHVEYVKLSAQKIGLATLSVIAGGGGQQRDSRTHPYRS